jgi:hypothetical protein
MLRNKVVEKMKTNIPFSIAFSENHAVRGKNMAETNRPEMTMQYGASALHAT